jgi:hypothetical protein
MAEALDMDLMILYSKIKTTFYYPHTNVKMQQKSYLQHALFRGVNIGDQMAIRFHQCFRSFGSAEEK